MSAALKICAIAGSAVCLAAPLFLGCQPPWLSGFLLALVLTIGAAYLLVALCSGEGVRLPKGVVFFALLLMGWLTINAGRDFMLGVEGGRDPQASLRHLFYAAAFFCAAVLGAGTVRSPDQLKRLLVAVIVLGVLLSITSFAQYLGRDLKRPFGESFYGQRINGIYTNPNRFAVMLTITWLACVAVGGDALIRRSRLERTRLEMGLLIGCLLAIATAIVLTLSRLTMMSIAAWIGIVALWWVYLFRRYQDSATAFRNAMHLDHGGRTVIIALLLPLLCVGAWITFTLTLGSTELQRRLSFDPSVHSRFAVMELSLPLLTANPFWGVGLGGFESAFGVIQPVGFPGRWREVHNDWLQLGIEAGLPALILALCLFGAWFYACARRVRDEWRANQHTFALRVIALGAVTVPLMCSLGDFPLREPGTAVACFFLAGALCSTRLKYEAPVLRIALKPIVVVKSEAPVFTGRDSQLGPAVTEPSASQLAASIRPSASSLSPMVDKYEPPRGARRAVMACAGIVAAPLLLVAAFQSARYSWAYANSPWAGRIDAPPPSPGLAEGWARASSLLPADPELLYQASVCESSGPEVTMARVRRAITLIDAALVLAPRDFRILAQAARVREMSGDVDAAAVLREQAIARRPSNAWLRYEAGDFYLRRLVSGNLPGTDRREHGLESAVRHLQVVIAAEPTRQPAIINKMDGAGCMVKEIAQLWPGDTEAERIERARFYFERDQWAEVDRALPPAPPSDSMLATWHHAISGALSFSRGELPAGKESWKLALRCNPQRITSGLPLEHWMLSQVKVLGADVVETFALGAIEELRRYPGLSQALAGVLIANRRYSSADQVLSELSLVSGDLCALWAELALLTGDTEAAAQRARRAWEQELSSPSRAAWYDEFRKRLAATGIPEKGNSRAQ